MDLMEWISAKPEWVERLDEQKVIPNSEPKTSYSSTTSRFEILIRSQS